MKALEQLRIITKLGMQVKIESWKYSLPLVTAVSSRHHKHTVSFGQPHKPLNGWK